MCSIAFVISIDSLYFLFSTFSPRDNINYDVVSIITRSAESGDPKVSIMKR
jgi:hypothetical protein